MKKLCSGVWDSRKTHSSGSSMCRLKLLFQVLIALLEPICCFSNHGNRRLEINIGKSDPQQLYFALHMREGVVPQHIDAGLIRRLPWCRYPRDFSPLWPNLPPSVSDTSLCINWSCGINHLLGIVAREATLVSVLTVKTFSTVFRPVNVTSVHE